MSTKELKNIAKERKLQNYHNLSKEDLSRMLKIPIFKTKRYYQNIAKDRNLKNYQNLKIADLIQLLNMKPEIPISKKPIPKPIPKPEKPISEKPIPAPRRNPPTIQKAIDTMLGWVDWFRESGKKDYPANFIRLKHSKKKNKYPL